MFIRRYNGLQQHQLRSNHQILWVIMMAVFLTVGSCNRQPVPKTETPIVPAASTSSIVEDSYPASANEPALATESYPAPVSTPQIVQSYPAPGETKDGIFFAINAPLRAGDVEVAGVGPSGVTVFLVNVTLMGEPLGSGTIGDDGTFKIVVPPLSANIQVGLTADLEAAGVDLDSIVPGEGARAIPLVGYYFDTVLVTE